MKTLNQHIQEKLIVNKNYKSVSYDFSNVKELYLVRFFKKNNKPENYITIDIINVESIIMNYSHTKDVTVVHNCKQLTLPMWYRKRY